MIRRTEIGASGEERGDLHSEGWGFKVFRALGFRVLGFRVSGVWGFGGSGV